MSIALYRKYRSATFADLIGQDHVATTLRNQVRRGEVSHAYLFSGIRGTGKTSTARILARAVACTDLRDGEPCNACGACVEILGGGAVDVLEIDAASNRGIDEMRDLREKVKFLPASLTKKVYIIDEAHMLTTEAWNAFLKTLEEPPPHVLFVLCTTEPHKVPDTVRSRVQRFDFRRVDLAALTAHLARVAEREEVAVDPEALDLVARSSQGSVRDALSLLDQAVAAGERPLGVAAVRRALGLADPRALRDIVAALATGDAAAALRAAADAFDAGADARQLLRELARLCRATELCALGLVDAAELASEEQAACRAAAAAGRRGLWVEALERLTEAEINLRQPVDARLQVELALLRICHTATASARAGPAVVPPTRAAVPPPRPVPPERTGEADAASPSGEPNGQPAMPVTGTPVVPVAAALVPEVVELSAPAQPPTVPELPAAAPDPLAASAGEGSIAPGAAPPADLDGWVARWGEVIEVVNRRDPMLAGVLRSCRPLQAAPGRLVVGAPYGFHLERLRDSQKAPLLAAAVVEVGGPGCVVEAVFSGGPDPAPAAVATTTEPEVDATQAALAAFPGSRLTGSRLRDRSLDQAGVPPSQGVGPLSGREGSSFPQA
jgi:DNA polymerase-3 subunit gamma/tau